ncbi:hypothetical protein N2152v2_009021 [Parachlorella kessleri]
MPKAPLLYTALKEVIEFAVEDGLLLALSATGVCVVFATGTWERLGFLNSTADEHIRSIIVNKARRELVVTSFQYLDCLGDHHPLRCRAVALQDLVARRFPAPSAPIFGSEGSISWPGFVDVDGDTATALTYNPATKLYKVWDLRDYSPRLIIRGRGIQDICLHSPDVALVTLHGSSGVLPIQLRSLVDGTVLREFCIPLGAAGEPEVLHLFGQHLLVRLPGGSLTITDSVSGSCVEVGDLALQHLQVFSHCPVSNTVLAFGDDGMRVFSLQGQQLGHVPGCVLPDRKLENAMHISRQEKHMVVYTGSHQHPAAPERTAAQGGPAGPTSQGGGGTASSDAAGSSSPAWFGSYGSSRREDSSSDHRFMVPDIGRIGASMGVVDLQRCKWLARLHAGRARRPEAVRQQHPDVELAALANVTAVYYDEMRCCIYTGSADGFVHIWRL